MLVGAHISVGPGYALALDYAEGVGAECMQIFAKSPRQWKGPVIDPEAAAWFVAERSLRGFGPVFTHTAYLLNLSTNNDELREKSILALAEELLRASAIDAGGVVTHVGNDPAGDLAAASQRAADSIVRAFELLGDHAAGVRLLLENTAGAGSSFGCDFHELGDCIRRSGLPASQLGVALDTCHAFAFGYGVDSAEGWAALVAELTEHVGLDRLGVIHANDCLFERGSRKDRHAWIGNGFIGDEGFRVMLCTPELADVPAIMELNGEKPEKDQVNLDRLKRLRESCAQA